MSLDTEFCWLLFVLLRLRVLLFGEIKRYKSPIRIKKIRIRMAAKSGENRNFSPFHRTLLYYHAGQKFARNRSISYGFRDIHTFSFSAKIQDGRQKWRKSNFFPFAQDTLVLPCGSKICLKSLYLLRFWRYSHFFIFRKNPRWPSKVAKIEILPLCTGYYCTTLWVKNSLEIALSLTICE